MDVKEALHAARYSLTDLVHNKVFGRPDVIIVGEMHGNGDFARDQARMIRRYTPEFVLHEFYGKEGPEYAIDDSVTGAVKETGGEMVGCDLELKLLTEMVRDIEISHGEGRLAGLSRKMYAADGYLRQVMEPREREMGKEIAIHAYVRKTGHPIMAILGSNHTRNGSAVYGRLKESAVKYRIIRQR